jgi:phosphotransferase system HPr-like phosphotransfer protein
MMSTFVLGKSIPFNLLEEIARQCSLIQSEVHIVKADHIANAKNILDLVTLSLHPEDRINVFIEGPDAAIAEGMLLELLN